eukprot:CAMPEP_0170176266 /NCGR_PEP_ID=MMETSP0040_2-20121228/9188_1 /TAXON_ID=641309 /ORGANISM="Lotharella oceanica, Strain CCMP622" /LENGTH=91 /DNA_ID=CAMNT_0010418537 /DNA_START=278 /DNA_END=553 /DNA_ORIENTATION=+
MSRAAFGARMSGGESHLISESAKSPRKGLPSCAAPPHGWCLCGRVHRSTRGILLEFRGEARRLDRSDVQLAALVRLFWSSSSHWPALRKVL